MNARTITKLGILTALALVLGWVEWMLPVSTIPGMKIGLANIVLLFAIYEMNAKYAALLMLLKVGLSSALFSGLTGMIFSLAGGTASLLVMLIVKKSKNVGILGVSVSGSVTHNLAQIVVACFVIKPVAAFSYLPLMLISGVVCGGITSVIAGALLKSKAINARIKT